MEKEEKINIVSPLAKEESIIAREIKDLTQDMLELRVNKHALEKENRELGAQVEALKARLSGADMVMDSLRTDINNSRAQIEKAPESLKDLEAKKDGLIEEINRCQSGIKTATKNIKNFLSMRSHLESELMDIVNEKALVLKKLQDTMKNVSQVEEQKAQKLPYLKECDMVLRQMSKTFREVENSMDVSIKFSTKRLQ